ncbi:hypothetical protein BT67DRAFT_444452 [Trichocladium antarcticum]|uniref:Uncharacterized protein n=1 Tax=Trichocladium antarcticum TaxID=1450529 RepID=A0AAN6UFB3_9PEZI|nr:hypothetical protein BT67DRAFT_444452 [Trichocladium antarcticum]
MALLTYDLTVLIAESVDMDSMAAFMLSSKTNYQLIRGHERSIVKAKIAKMAHGHDPTLRTPRGALLSSAPPRPPGLDRAALEPGSFAVARELESRARQTNRLCGPPLVDAVRGLPLFQHLPPRHMERLIGGLRDACAVADRIADCAAVAHHTDDVHLARQQHIRSLSPLRLAFLALLASLVGTQYEQQQQQQQLQSRESDSDSDSDRFQRERVTAFKETFLRHGAVGVCALLCPPEHEDEDEDESAPARYYASQVEGVLGELLEYEGGNATRAVPDSLHMTMLRALQGCEEAEEADRALEDVDGGEEEDGDGDGDGDGGWLFKIDVVDGDADGAGDSPPPSMSGIKSGPRGALLVHRWIMQHDRRSSGAE